MNRVPLFIGVGLLTELIALATTWEVCSL